MPIHNFIIFLSLLLPLSLLQLILEGRAKRITMFLLIGLFVCFFSGEVSGLIFSGLGVPFDIMTVNVTPFVEEILKAFPLVLYAFLFRPPTAYLMENSLAIGIGFAVYENLFILTAADGGIGLAAILLRCALGGVVHGGCTLLVGYGLSYVSLNRKLAYTGTFALLSMAMTIHSICNMMSHAGGNAAVIFYIALALGFAAVMFRIKSAQH